MSGLLLYNAGVIFTAAGGPRRSAALNQPSYAAGDAILCLDGVVAAIGPLADVEPAAGRDCATLDCGGRLVTPGWVDCHTHLVYGGSRADEYEMRLRGATYLEISEAGGGILASTRATQAATEDQLLDAARARARVMLADGTTTAEVKSGYGLTLDAEMKLLRVASRLGEVEPLEIVPTFMGAHAIPPEFEGGRTAFVRSVAEEMTPAVARAGLAEYADVFCDRGAFDLAETTVLLTAARQAGLGIRVHADEFEPLGAAQLAAALGAASADHLAVVTDDGIRALAKSSTVAVLLPGTTVFLGSSRFAPARALIEAGAVVAVGSDHNPGSCHASSLLTIVTPAASFLKMTACEILHAVTINAASALGRADRVGSLQVGKQADVAVFDCAHPNQLLYDWGRVRAWATIKKGAVVHAAV